MFPVDIFPPVLRFFFVVLLFYLFFFCRELAVKQVQFEHVNTGSFLFFSGCGDGSKGVEVKIYENKTFCCFFLTPPPPCETKATGCAQNNERTSEWRGLPVRWVCGCVPEEVGPTFELTGRFCSLHDYTINSRNTQNCRNALQYCNIRQLNATRVELFKHPPTSSRHLWAAVLGQNPFSMAHICSKGTRKNIPHLRLPCSFSTNLLASGP